MKAQSMILIFAAAAIPAATPGNDLRHALQLLEAGDADRALLLLESVAPLVEDPGFVAFNRGVAFSCLGRWRDAELQFLYALDDDLIPADRKARALYNRGACLLIRGDDLAALRAAIESFSRCLEMAPEEALLADARHNLELAKLRWLHLRMKQPKTSSPNETDSSSRPKDAASNQYKPDNEATPSKSVKPGPSTVEKNSGEAKNTTQSAPGVGTLPVLRDDAVLSPLSPQDTQIYLDQIAKRLARQRQSVERLRGGPDRPGVRDW